MLTFGRASSARNPQANQEGMQMKEIEYDSDGNEIEKEQAPEVPQPPASARNHRRKGESIQDSLYKLNS